MEGMPAVGVAEVKLGRPEWVNGGRRGEIKGGNVVYMIRYDIYKLL